MFHVPKFGRIIEGELASDDSYGNNGAFILNSPITGWKLVCIVSDAGNWEHVSVHARRFDIESRTPTWDEMNRLKNVFWDEKDVVIQYHPKKLNYINRHPNVLHMWRPIGIVIPEPPVIFV